MHIFKRKKTYYFKLKIPSDLKHLVSIKEVRFSLRTHIKRDAIQLSSTLVSKYYTLFSQIRCGLHTEAELNSLINERLYPNLRQFNLKTVNNYLPNGISIKDLSELYREDKLITKSWSEKTSKAFSFVFLIFSKVIDTRRDLKEITRQDLQTFKSVLIQLPLLKPNQHQLTLEQILELNQRKISTSTANKYLSYLVSFFKWCEIEGYVNKNVATGLAIKEKEGTKEKRKPYSDEDLRVLFCESPLFTSELRKTLSSNPERIFIPLIALYQGMRINEIAQLYVSDVYVLDEVYCIDINKNTKDKRLKNEASIRIIPVHQKLIELGFIDFVEDRKKRGETRLWSNLSLGLEGYATSFRKWYGVFNRKYITKDKTKTFHSFRHTFTDRLKQISLKESIDHHSIKFILGHSFKSDVTMDVYTHGYNMRELSIILNKLVFEDLKFSDVKSL